jgi:hypothetical protein
VTLRAVADEGEGVVLEVLLRGCKHEMPLVLD